MKKIKTILLILRSKSYVLMHENGKQLEIDANIPDSLAPHYSYAMIEACRSVGFLLTVTRRPLGFPKEGELWETEKTGPNE